MELVASHARADELRHREDEDMKLARDCRVTDFRSLEAGSIFFGATREGRTVQAIKAENNGGELFIALDEQADAKDRAVLYPSEALRSAQVLDVTDHLRFAISIDTASEIILAFTAASQLGTALIQGDETFLAVTGSDRASTSPLAYVNIKTGQMRSFIDLTLSFVVARWHLKAIDDLPALALAEVLTERA
jgi:hypothetical protein